VDYDAGDSCPLIQSTYGSMGIVKHLYPQDTNLDFTLAFVNCRISGHILLFLLIFVTCAVVVSEFECCIYLTNTKLGVKVLGLNSQSSLLTAEDSL